MPAKNLHPEFFDFNLQRHLKAVDWFRKNENHVDKKDRAQRENIVFQTMMVPSFVDFACTINGAESGSLSTKKEECLLMKCSLQRSVFNAHSTSSGSATVVLLCSMIISNLHSTII